MDSVSQKRNAIIGFIGGVIFMIGDFLLYMFPGRNPDLDVDPVFADMPVWRFTGSALCGFIGMALMLFGFQSLYGMTKRVCGKVLPKIMLIGAAGVGGTTLAHFNLGCLMPFTYKAMLSVGIDPELADQACQAIIPWVTPIDLLIIIAIFVQALVLVIMLLGGKSGLSRWFVLMGPIGAITLGVIWKIIFKDTLIGNAWGACESLGEGLMYLTAYFYWKKNP